MNEDEDEADDAVEEEKMRDDSDEPVDVDGDAEDDDLMDYGFWRSNWMELRLFIGGFMEETEGRLLIFLRWNPPKCG